MRFLSLGLGFALCVSVALPWFSLPLLGWAVPTPAWNALGLALLLLGACQLLRALNLPGMPWAVRLLLPWTLWRWWTAEELFRQWGKQTFAPLQLRLSGVNQALSTVGAEPISVFDPTLWRDVEPGLGWKLAGVSLFLSLIVTLFDQPVRTRCSACQARISPEDRCCHGCGQQFPQVPGCLQCGRKPEKDDKHCRSCGRELAPPTPS